MMNWVEFDKLSIEYKERFGAHLPTELMPPSDFARSVEIMRECLAKGKPYELSEKTRQLIERGAKF